MDLVTNVVRGANATRLLLLIHGRGADERDLEGLLPHLDPDGQFITVLPRAPHESPPGYTWFEDRSRDFAPAVDAVDDLLDAMCDEHGMQRFEAIVAGFSQGAALSLGLALRRGLRPRPLGVLAMSGWLMDGEGIEYDWEAAGGVPVFMQHGSADPLVPVRTARQSARTLVEHGVPTLYGEYPMGHQVALESMQDARQWLNAVLAGEHPAGPPPPLDEAPPDEDLLVKSVDAASWEREVLQSDVPVIVDFWAPWCQPCRMVAPVVEQIASMREGSYKVVKLNIDENPALAQEYDVQSIPLIGLFRNGRLERASLGAKPRPQLEAELGMLVIP
jgi:thioredoxin 1